MQLQAKLIVTFVWGIIIFEGSTYLTIYVPLLYQHNFLFFSFMVPIFLMVVSFLCVSYYKSIYCEPGHPNNYINIHYQDELEEIKLKAQRQKELKKLWRAKRRKGQYNRDQIKSLNEVSYCFKCDLVKEPRVHHCSVCKKCIERMDHHCPWVGNCVGRYNHKFFILFLFYATIGLLIVAITFTIDFMTGGFYSNQLSEMQYYRYYFSCITSYMLASSIGFLFVTQIFTAARNITTLESFTQGLDKNNIFDIGSAYQNLRQIFGKSNWFLPTNPFPSQCPIQSGLIDVL